MKKLLRPSAITLLISLLATAAFGQANDPSGRWTSKLERGSRSMTSVMTLKLFDNQVTGTIDLAPNVSVQIRNGKLENTQLTFDVTAPEHGRTKEIHFVGEVQSDVITLRNESRGRQGRTIIYHRSKD